MRVACVLIPDFQVAVVLTRRPELAGRPVVVGGLPHERKAVRACSPEAAAHGIAEGMPLRQAHGLCPEALFLPADEELGRAALARLLRTLDGFSPSVEPPAVSPQSSPPGKRSAPSPRHSTPGTQQTAKGPLAIYLDAAGLELLFGPDEELGRRVAAAVERETGLRPRVGLAAGQFVARMAALLAAPGSALVVRAGEERSFLAPLPVERLPCSRETLRRLGLLGLGTLGQLAALPPGALAEQFGPEGAELFRLARGVDEMPVVAREIPALLEEGTEMDPPAGESGPLLAAAAALIARLVARLRSGYLACREVTLHLGLSDGSALHLSTTLHEPATSAGDIRRAVERLMGRTDLSHEESGGRRDLRGVCHLRISLSGFGGERGEQLGLFGSGGGGPERVRRAVERVEERFGEGILHPLAELEGGRPLARPLRVAADREGRPGALFLEGRREGVREVCNRWRIGEDWWRREVFREYYRVITDGGRLCLLFRDLIDGGWFLERVHE